MATVVLHLSSAVSAGQNWSANTTKRLRLTFRVVKEAVVAWMQSSLNRHAGGNLDCNPMTKLHVQLVQVRAEKHIPLRQVVEEQRPARLQDSNTFPNPLFTPRQIF